jgi:hypothetical protein
MNEKCKSTSPSAIQVKNWQKTLGTEEKLHISRLQKGGWIIHVRRNVTLAHSSVHKIRVNADRIKEGIKLGTDMCVRVARLPQSYPHALHQKTMDVSLFKFLLH